MKQILFYLLTITSIVANSQVLTCANQSVSLVQNSLCRRDLESIAYIPTATSPTSTFRINYHFLIHPSQSTPFNGYTQQQMYVECLQNVIFLNSKFASCGNIPSLLTAINPSPLLPDSKIRLVLNQVFTHTTSLAIQANPTLLSTRELIKNSFPQDTSSALNVYFYTAQGLNDGGYGVPLIGSVFMVSTPQSIYTLGTSESSFGNLLWHEIGHALANFPDLYYGQGGGPTYGDPIDGAYYPDDATRDIVANYTCPSAQANNNVMGNSPCRDHYSAKQIAVFHYLVAKNITKKYTTLAGSYPLPTQLLSVGTVSLNGVVSFSNTNNTFNNLVINPGADITFNNSNLNFVQGGRLIVKPGAKLTLNCVKLQSLPDFVNWGGIEVWGNSQIFQDLSNTGGSSNQGVLYMNDCIITRAVVGITVGKRLNGFGIFQQGTGGGIVFANNSNFINNSAAVEMIPHYPVSGGGPMLASNYTTFNSCFFRNYDYWMSTYGSSFLVRLNGVRDIKFNGCQFELNKPSNSTDTTYCIKSFNSNVKVNSCVFQGTKVYGGAFLGIHVTGTYAKNTIEDCEFFTRNGIYLGNTTNAKIVRNIFYMDSMQQIGTTLRTGIYFDKSIYYKVENNIFFTSSTPGKAFSEGIVVNSSGPYSNQIYNNRFTRLALPIWCQNQNYDPITLNGLKINCNEFTYDDYHIGVQSSLTDPIAGNNTGVAQTQGIINGLIEENVRNRYSSLVNCFNDEKYYSYTIFNQPPQLIHGSFLGSPFGVNPQPGCSDPSEILNLQVNNPPPGGVPSYCPNKDFYPTNKIFFTQSISTKTLKMDQLKSELAFVDGGDTQALLNAIYSNTISYGNLKSLLLNKRFLSDTVLKAYFGMPNVPDGHDMQIHEKNAPVSLPVWQVIIEQDYSNGTMAAMNSKQFVNNLSERRNLEAELQLNQNERSYDVMHKTMFFLDSELTAPNFKDSIAKLIYLNNEGDVPKQLIELDIEFRDYINALKKLDGYANANSPAQKNEYVSFMKTYIDVLQSSDGLYSLQNTSSPLKGIFENAAAKNTHPCKLLAQNVLGIVFERNFPVEKLSPIVANARPAVVKRNERKKRTIRPDALLENTVFIFPNPAANQININNGTGDKVTVKVFNVSGQLIVETQLKEEYSSLNTESLLNGIYFVHLSITSGFTKTEKLVIAR